jgi:hypothetical protein
MTQIHIQQGSATPIGLVAAWGRFPILVAEALKRNGYRVCCLAIKYHADPVLREICDDFHWLGMARLGEATRWFRKHGVKQATMAGKFHKVFLYRPWLWPRFIPDWTTAKVFWPHFIAHKGDRKDDTLLGVLTDAFAQKGVIFQPATDFVPNLLVPPGTVAGKPPTRVQQTDIEFGWSVAKEMGRLDIGQSVCVKARAILAVEAIEGTDLCIERAGQLCPQGSFVVVKVAKPQQDMRFDVPTVGVGTLQTMVAAGASVLAIEGGRTILLDDTKFRAFARKYRLSILALPDRTNSSAAA